MKIEYIHQSDPKKIKIHDTEKAYKNMASAINDPATKLYKKTQAEFDEMYIDIFKKDKARGVILYFKILEE